MKENEKPILITGSHRPGLTWVDKRTFQENEQIKKSIQDTINFKYSYIEGLKDSKNYNKIYEKLDLPYSLPFN